MSKVTFDCGVTYYFKGSINGEITIEQNDNMAFIAYSEYGEKMVEHYGSFWTFLDVLKDILNNEYA